jgi:broad specificity phosphatase PhoE
MIFAATVNGGFMSRLRRIVLLRHGETVGQSSIRFHGRNDVPLDTEGLAQADAARYALRNEYFDLVASSPLQRAWSTASIVAQRAPVRIVSEFREVDFGRWEGLTAKEIEAQYPALYEDWQARAAGFEYPGGEPRGAFEARVLDGFSYVQRMGAESLLVVAHKGVIRTIAEHLGAPIQDGHPELGQGVGLTRAPNGEWFGGLERG